MDITPGETRVTTTTTTTTQPAVNTGMNVGITILVAAILIVALVLIFIYVIYPSPSSSASAAASSASPNLFGQKYIQEYHPMEPVVERASGYTGNQYTEQNVLQYAPAYENQYTEQQHIPQLKAKKFIPLSEDDMANF